MPVLSKTKVVILPDKFTLGGEIQKILCFLSLKIAKATPQLIAAGKAGGTQMTIRFRNLSMNVEDAIPNLKKLEVNKRNRVLRCKP